MILTLKDSEKEFLNEWTLRGIITKYSDHISTPVWLWEKETPADEKKEPTWKWVQVNDAKALWTLPPKDVKDEQYKEFYTTTIRSPGRITALKATSSTRAFSIFRRPLRGISITASRRTG